MSAFLGPIHHWLYNKIMIQNEVTNKVIEYGKQLGLSLDQDLKEKYGEISQEPLETLIDHQNIHGWLQSQVSVVEYRLAYAVTKIIESSDTAMKDLKQIFFESGKARTPGKEKTLAQIYQLLTDSLLDGMPCDRANEIVTEEDTYMTWKRNICVHQDYWDQVDGDITNYYHLREAFIQGLLSDTDIIYRKLDDRTSKIERR